MDQGLMLMLYGLTGVFTVLMVFYFIIKILVKIFPYKIKQEEEPKN